MNRRQFRLLVLAIGLGTAMLFVAGGFPDPLIPVEVRTALAPYEQANAETNVFLAAFFALVLLISVAAGLWGLYLFRRWSLWLNVVLVLVGPLFGFFSGYIVLSWVAAAVAGWCNTGLGVALAVAYLTPLRCEFK